MIGHLESCQPVYNILKRIEEMEDIGIKMKGENPIFKIKT